MSVGGGSNKQSSSSSSASNSVQYGSDVWGAQSPYLQQLYGQAAANLGNTGTADAQSWLNQAGGSLDSATASLNQSNQGLMQFLNPAQDPALASYAQNLGQQFNEQFLPGLQGEAALAGGLGGSRQQIGSALGAQRSMQTLADFTAQTYAGQQDRALQAAGQIGANASGFQNNANMQGTLADFARSMPWYQLSQFQGLLGTPILRDLGGESSSTSSSKGKTSGWNASIGYNAQSQNS
jgi:hypothetical protein